MAIIFSGITYNFPVAIETASNTQSDFPQVLFPYLKFKSEKRTKFFEKILHKKITEMPENYSLNT
jgi:hypothetical protein